MLFGVVPYVVVANQNLNFVMQIYDILLSQVGLLEA